MDAKVDQKTKADFIEFVAQYFKVALQYTDLAIQAGHFSAQHLADQILWEFFLFYVHCNEQSRAKQIALGFSPALVSQHEKEISEILGDDYWRAPGPYLAEQDSCHDSNKYVLPESDPQIMNLGNETTGTESGHATFSQSSMLFAKQLSHSGEPPIEPKSP